MLNSLLDPDEPEVPSKEHSSSDERSSASPFLFDSSSVVMASYPRPVRLLLFPVSLSRLLWRLLCDSFLLVAPDFSGVIVEALPVDNLEFSATFFDVFDSLFRV